MGMAFGVLEQAMVASTVDNHCLYMRESSSAVEPIIASTSDDDCLKPRKVLTQVKWISRTVPLILAFPHFSKPPHPEDYA